MGKQKKSGNRLAAQIAAEESEDDQVMLAPQESTEEPDGKAGDVNAAEGKDAQDAPAAQNANDTPAPVEKPVMYTAEQVQQMNTLRGALMDAILAENASREAKNNEGRTEL